MNILRKGMIMSTLIMGLVLVSCSNDEDTDLVGNWVRKKLSFDGPARSKCYKFRDW
jgi:hypothetical protein